MNAALYVRVSTDEQAREGVSIEQQIARLTKYCEGLGLGIAVVFREESVSGSTPLAERPGGAQLLNMIASGQVQHVVALKLDRLFRDTIDALSHVPAWDSQGVAFHLVDQGGQSINSGSAMGKAMLTVMAMFAELERGLISERTAAALQHLKTQHRPYCRELYGYDRQGAKLVKNPTEQAIIRRIFRQHKRGLSLAAIARNLTAERVATKRGGTRWYPSTVRAILLNELHAA